MRLRTPFVLFVLSAACGSVPIDDERGDSRLLQPKGVIHGTLTYQGPPPCTQNGQITGAAVLLVFDRKNPPPPTGIAATATNFAVIAGDVLFANVPRATGPELVCPPATTTLTTTAPFTIAPMEAGSYQIVAFYDREGTFLPTFKIRNLPRRGDVGGGAIDATDALKHLGDVNYQPIYQAIDVGNPQALPADAPAGTIPAFTMPREGFVRDNVQVTIGAPLPLARPHFWPDGADKPSTKGAPNDAPVVTMTQDHHLRAPPASRFPEPVNTYQAGFVSLKLNYGVPSTELAAATDPKLPFRMQIDLAARGGGLFVWGAGREIPEGEGVPQLWPLVVLTKLADDPTGAEDPQGVRAQGGRKEPIVILQGITLRGDTLIDTALAPPPKAPGADALQDHVTVLLRPAAICFDATRVDAGGVLVTPHLTGESADPSEQPRVKPLFDIKTIRKNLGRLVREDKRGCLPKGRYAINAVYPTGQAWTVPNEAGRCAQGEGPTDFGAGTCVKKPRPILYSQGTRAVVEIVDAKDPSVCQEFPVPAECLPTP